MVDSSDFYTPKIDGIPAEQLRFNAKALAERLLTLQFDRGDEQFVPYLVTGQGHFQTAHLSHRLLKLSHGPRQRRLHRRDYDVGH